MRTIKKPAITLLLLLTPLFSVVGADQVISEFGKCARFHVVPEKKSPWLAAIKAATRYEVLRRRSPSNEYELVLKQDYIQTEEEILKRMNISPSKAKDSVEIADGYKIQRKNSFGVEDILRRKEQAFLLGAFNPRTTEFLGAGYYDCALDNEDHEISYQIRYLKGNEDLGTFPKSPVKMVRQALNPAAPGIEKVNPIEGGVELVFARNMNTEQKDKNATIMGFNAYVKRGEKTEKLNKLLIVDSEGKGKIIRKYEGFKPGESCVFFTRAVSFSMQEGDPGKEAEYIVRSLRAPEPVQKVEIAPISSGLEISWQKSEASDVLGYNVYESPRGIVAGKYAKVNKFPVPREKTKYVHAMPVKERTYAYRVTAVDLSGNESTMSAAAQLDYRNMEKPGSPEITDVVRKGKNIIILWKYEGRPVKGFLLFRNANAKEDAQPIGKVILGDKRQFIDENALPGSSYWYAIKAYSFAGVISEYSVPKRIEVPVEIVRTRPGKFRAEAGETGVALYWDLDQQRPWKGFQLYRKSSNGARARLNNAVISATTSNYLDEEIKNPEKSIEYELVPIDDTAAPAEKFKATVSVRPFRKKLLPPEIRIISSRPGSLTVTWQADTNRSRDTTYELYRKSEAEEKFSLVAKVSGDKADINQTVPKKGRYVYFLRKKDKNGEHINSALISYDFE